MVHHTLGNGEFDLFAEMAAPVTCARAIVSPQNAVYETERLLTNDPSIAYNDLAAWHYSELPHALGCDGWFTSRVITCGALDVALKEARQNGTGSYVEVVTDMYTAPPLPEKLHESVATLYA